MLQFVITILMLIACRRQWPIAKKQRLITLESCWILCTMSIIGEKATLGQGQCAMLVPNHAGLPIVWLDSDVNGVA